MQRPHSCSSHHRGRGKVLKARLPEQWAGATRRTPRFQRWCPPHHGQGREPITIIMRLTFVRLPSATKLVESRHNARETAKCAPRNLRVTVWTFSQGCLRGGG